MAAVVAPAAVGVGAGTTFTTGPPVVVGVGVGAVPTAVDRTGGDEPAEGLGAGTPEEPPPTAQAMPAEPTTAAAPSTTTGP